MNIIERLKALGITDNQILEILEQKNKIDSISLLRYYMSDIWLLSLREALDIYIQLKKEFE